MIAGHQALNAKTLAVTILAPTDWTLQWIRWCSDGLHAVMLLTENPQTKQQMRVCHVASGTVTASSECVGIPTIPKLRDSEEAGRVETDMYMPCKAQAVLVPESLQVVALRRLPSLDSMAQIAAPAFGGRPASLLSMGWADQDSLIVLVWEAADAEVVVTVHLAHSGASLQHMLHLTPHDPRHPAFNDENVLKAFAASPDDPIAAIAWHSGGSDIHVALLDLTCSTQTNLQRPLTHHTPGTCYNEKSDEEMELAWSPGGRYLMVHETADADADADADSDGDADADAHDWAIFTSPAGVFLGPEYGCHNYDDPPMWSSDLIHPFCLVGNGLGAAKNAMDLLIVPPLQLSDLNSSRSGPYYLPEYCGFHPAFTAFVPGTRDLVVLRTGVYQPPIQHWTFDSSTASSLSHHVLGLTPDYAAGFAVENMAWQPSIKSAAMYAVAETRGRCLHLIDAQRHRRLITWTPDKMASMLQEPMSMDQASLAWSHDGKQLAVVSKRGTAILTFMI